MEEAHAMMTKLEEMHKKKELEELNSTTTDETMTGMKERMEQTADAAEGASQGSWVEVGQMTAIVESSSGEEDVFQTEPAKSTKNKRERSRS